MSDILVWPKREQPPTSLDNVRRISASALRGDVVGQLEIVAPIIITNATDNLAKHLRRRNAVRRVL